MWLVVSGYVIESVMCVGVQCGENLLYYDKFYDGVIFDQKGSKFDVFHPSFGPSSFIREFQGQMESGCL